MTDTKEMSFGVQELIDKLRDQGITEGQREAEQIIDEAHSKASELLLQAQKDIDALLAEARQKIETEQKASHEAIRTAFRDSEIALRSKLRDAFSSHLKRLVSLELKDKDFINQLILAIATIKGSQIDPSASIEILLPAKLFEMDADNLRLNKEGKEQLRHLVLGINNEMLREGIELLPSSDIKGGIKVRLVGEDMEIDLTDETISNLLLKYLLPRYREIISGQDQA
jgi:V/A-type H+-transporting ATPase subunit E